MNTVRRILSTHHAVYCCELIAVTVSDFSAVAFFKSHQPSGIAAVNIACGIAVYDTTVAELPSY